MVASRAHFALHPGPAGHRHAGLRHDGDLLRPGAAALPGHRRRALLVRHLIGIIDPFWFLSWRSNSAWWSDCTCSAQPDFLALIAGTAAFPGELPGGPGLGDRDRPPDAGQPVGGHPDGFRSVCRSSARSCRRASSRRIPWISRAIVQVLSLHSAVRRGRGDDQLGRVRGCGISL